MLEYECEDLMDQHCSNKRAISPPASDILHKSPIVGYGDTIWSGSTLLKRPACAIELLAIYVLDKVPPQIA